MFVKALECSFKAVVEFPLGARPLGIGSLPGFPDPGNVLLRTLSVLSLSYKEGV